MATRTMNTYDLIWSPTGQHIATVTASTMRAAIRKAPKPYSRYKGEIYAKKTNPRNNPSLGKWLKSRAVRIRKVAGKLILDIKR
jgi:hypothetical protein